MGMEKGGFFRKAAIGLGLATAAAPVAEAQTAVVDTTTVHERVAEPVQAAPLGNQVEVHMKEGGKLEVRMAPAAEVTAAPVAPAEEVHARTPEEVHPADLAPAEEVHTRIPDEVHARPLDENFKLEDK